MLLTHLFHPNHGWWEREGEKEGESVRRKREMGEREMWEKERSGRKREVGEREK